MNTNIVCLLSSLAWGIAPIFGRLGLRNVAPIQGLAIRTVITSAFVFGALAAGMGPKAIMHVSTRDCLFIGVESVLATFAGDLAYYVSLKYGSVASTASILAVSPVVTLWLAATLLKEQISAPQIVGTGLVFAGLVLVLKH